MHSVPQAEHNRIPSPLISGRSLPARGIQPLGRLDGSGATSLFTGYLATSGSWALGSHTLPSFPPCVARVQGSDGVVAALQSKNFSIACAPAHALTATHQPGCAMLVPGSAGVTAALQRREFLHRVRPGHAPRVPRVPKREAA